ncbi:Gly-Xaa carboxypeptidase [Malassezia brasiliensis]|uniref:Gly-Xaa carboxypeptidase n=1 Tax=Malassezia brasiliensis TaxID=1821822 RepID=A0AAF0DUT8_9BASI|nr:Gly-Xaa carboxypeptidase [Malassezia brasiliensis]
MLIDEDHPFPDKIEEKSEAQIRFLQCLRDHPQVSEKLRYALMELEYAERSLDTDFLRLYATELPVYEQLYLTAAPIFVQQNRLDRARKRVLELLSENTRLVLKTTQAVNVIEGGVKVNALPESAQAIVNHRIAPYSSVAETQNRYKKLLAPIAKSLELSFTAFDEVLVPHTNSSVGTLVVTNESKKPFKESVRVTPSTMFANTDTFWYRNLTKNVFRFGPATLHRDLTGIPMLHTTHTVNEHVSIDAIMKAIEFYTNLVVAVDFEDITKV